MGSSGNVRAGGAYVEIGGDDSALKKALDKAASRFKSFGSVVTAMGTKIFAAAQAIIQPLNAAGIAYAEMGNSMYRASQRTGVSVESLSELGYAARQSGIDLETLEGGLRKLQKGVVAGSKPVQEALQRMGMSVEDLKGLSPEDQMKAIADGLGNIEDPTARAAVAMQLFGKSGTALLPLLAEGGAGITQLQARARALGLTMSTESARGAVELHGRIHDLTDVMKNGLYRIGEAVAPVLRQFAEQVTMAAIKVNAWVSSHKELIQSGLRVAKIVSLIGAGMIVVGTGISLVGVVLSKLGLAVGLVSKFGSMLMLVANPIGIIVALLTGLAAYFVYATETGRRVLGALGDYFGGLKDTALAAFGGIRDALAAGDWTLAAQVAWAGLKLVWAQGIQPLKEKWLELKNFALVVWEQLTDGIAQATVRVTSFLLTTWEQAKAKFMNLVQNIGDTGVAALIIAKHQAGIISDQEYHAQMRNLNESHDASIAANENELEAKLAAIEKEKAAQLQMLEFIHRAEMGNLKTASEEERAAAEEEMRQKKADLIVAIEEASLAAATAAKNKGLPAVPILPETPGLPDADDLEGIDKKIKSHGTFSAAGAFGLAAGGPQLRTALAAEKTAKLIEQVVSLMNRNLGIGGLTFSGPGGGN